MNETIEEETVNFENEPEAKRFLRKDALHIEGGMDYDLVKAIKKVRTSKNNKTYTEYELTVKDDYGEYALNCFRENLKFNKVNPKRVNISVEQQDKFLNWIVKPI